MIEFSCPACRHAYRLPNSAEGKGAKCVCGHALRVPSASEQNDDDSKASITADIAAPESTANDFNDVPVIRTTSSRRSRRRSSLFADPRIRLALILGIGSTLLVGVICTSIWYFVSLNTHSPKFPEQAHAEFREALETKDWEAYYDVLTPDSQVFIAESLAFFGVMGAERHAELRLVLQANGIDVDNYDISQRTASSAELLQRLVSQPEERRQLIANVQDRRAFVISMSEAISQIDPAMSAFATNQQTGPLSNVQVTGTHATGMVSTPLYGPVPQRFEKIDGAWYVDITVRDTATPP